MKSVHLDRPEQLQLLQLARTSINAGFAREHAQAVDLTDYSPGLLETVATFVTLEKMQQLRGCVGSVKAYRSLVEDVSENAWNAAFQDPRFSPVTPGEISQIQITISVLSHPEPLNFDSEIDLKRQINPGQDGLILSDGARRGLFLPSVWKKLPDVDSFFAHLKQKAGFSFDYWSNTIRVERFRSFEFGDDD